jgi:predicted phosphodiesterase
MKIALLADIHGNDIALEVVLKDIENQGGADAYWVVGDLVAIGHAPVRVLERLRELPQVHFVRGNTDRYVCTGDRPPPVVAEVAADVKLIPQLLEIEGDFSWTQGAVTNAGWLPWLCELPLEYRQTLPDGTRALCVHAAPGADDGRGIKASMSEEDIERIVADCQADLVCVGHTHLPFSLHVGGVHVVNPGSVSNPIGEDLGAKYAVITADESGYTVEHHQVDYDQEAVIKIVEDIRHPARKFIALHMRRE